MTTDEKINLGVKLSIGDGCSIDLERGYELLNECKNYLNGEALNIYNELKDEVFTCDEPKQKKVFYMYGNNVPNLYNSGYGENISNWDNTSFETNIVDIANNIANITKEDVKEKFNKILEDADEITISKLYRYLQNIEKDETKKNDLDKLKKREEKTKRDLKVGNILNFILYQFDNYNVSLLHRDINKELTKDKIAEIKRSAVDNYIRGANGISPYIMEKIAYVINKRNFYDVCTKLSADVEHALKNKIDIYPYDESILARKMTIDDFKLEFTEIFKLFKHPRVDLNILRRIGINEEQAKQLNLTVIR